MPSSVCFCTNCDCIDRYCVAQHAKVYAPKGVKSSQHECAICPVQWNISTAHTRSSRDCGSPFGEHVTLPASCFGLETFSGVFVFGVAGVESFCGVFIFVLGGVFVLGMGGVLSATYSRALRIYTWTSQKPLTIKVVLALQPTKS